MVAEAREVFRDLHIAYMGDDRKEIETMEKKWDNTKLTWAGYEPLLQSMVIDWYNDLLSKH
jgi:hypothetical protein